MDENNPQLKVMESLAKFMEGNFALAEDVAQHIESINKDIESLEERIDASMSEMKDKMMSDIEDTHDAHMSEMTAIKSELADIKNSINAKASKMMSEIGGSISDVKEELYNEVKKLYALIKDIPSPIEVNEQAIIDNAVRQSKTETEKLLTNARETLGEDVVEAINSLPTNDDNKKIDASHIKNLPKASGNFWAGGSRLLRNLADTNISNPADGDVLVYNATQGKWVNDTSSGGVGAWTEFTLSGTPGERTGVTFSVASAPTDVNNDGLLLYNQHGYTYNSGAGTITFDNPPQYFAGWR